MHNAIRWMVAALAGLELLGGMAHAQGDTYFRSANDVWANAANWDNGLPTAGNVAHVGYQPGKTNPATVWLHAGDAGVCSNLDLGRGTNANGTLAMDGGFLQVAQRMTIGSNGVGAVIQTGGAISNTAFTLGYLGGVTCRWTMAGGAVTNNGASTDYCYIGYGNGGVGDLVISNTGVMVGGQFRVAFTAGSTGSVRVLSGGTFQPLNNVVLSNDGSLIVSNAQFRGELMGGAATTVGSASPGHARVSDASANFTYLYVGASASGNGDMTMEGVSTVTVANTLGIGWSSGATGTLTLAGGTWNQAGGTSIGNSIGSVGRMVLNGAVFQPAADVKIGSLAGGVGSLIVSNASWATTSTTAKVLVGSAGTGTLAVINGSMDLAGQMQVGGALGATGVVNLVNASVTNRQTVSVGNVAGSWATVLQNGGSWVITNNAACSVGVNGIGSYFLSNGVLQAGILTLGANSGSAGRVELTGTQRLVRVNKLVVGVTGSTGALTNHVQAYAGGVDVTNAASDSLSISASGRLHLAFENPVVTGMYWAVRWNGNAHASALSALHTNTPALLTWDDAQMNPLYQGKAGVYTDATYTYVGIPVTRLAQTYRGCAIMLR